MPGLPPHLEGSTIAHLTDFHGGSFLRHSDLKHVIDATNALRPDLVVLTGDFVTHRTAEALELIPAFEALRAPLGVFAVFGNHDYRGRREGEIAAALRNIQIEVLRNTHREVAPGFVVSGVEDLEEGKYCDFDAALAGAGRPPMLLMLSHHPGGFEVSRNRGVHLVLSGHTHGNQVRWPVLRNLGPRHPGDRLDVDGCTLIVSHGIGAIGIPFRAGAPAEIVLVQLSARRGARVSP